MWRRWCFVHFIDSGNTSAPRGPRKHERSPDSKTESGIWRREIDVGSLRFAV
jgi:hypothetical protein